MTRPRGRIVNYGEFLAGGADIRFASADESTALPYEIELWDAAGTSCIWVKAPVIAGPTDSIWMYWGKADAVDDQNAPAVWSNGYRLVWHMDQPSGGTYPDSTGNGNVGTQAGGLVDPLQPGVVGYASDFWSEWKGLGSGINADGADALNGGSAAAIGIGPTGTGRNIELWVYPRLSLDTGIVEIGEWFWGGYAGRVIASPAPYADESGANPYYSGWSRGEGMLLGGSYAYWVGEWLYNGKNNRPDGPADWYGFVESWTHINWTQDLDTLPDPWIDDLAGDYVREEVTFDGDRERWQFGRPDTVWNAGQQFNIGGSNGYWWSGGGLPGKYDEVRVSATGRSRDWVKASYDTALDNFINTGTAEAGGPYFIEAFGTDSIVLSGSGTPSPAGSSIVSYEWDIDMDTQFDDETGASPTVTWPELEAMELQPNWRTVNYAEWYPDRAPSPVGGVGWFGDYQLLDPRRRINLRVTDDTGRSYTDKAWLSPLFPPAPTADAQCPAFAYEGNNVLLDGTASTGATDYLWTQLAGKTVTINDDTAAVANFDAPAWDGSTELTAAEASLQFQLAINSGASTDTCDCYVRIPGDANGDCVVNAFDVSLVRTLDPSADFNGDGSVNAFDVSILRISATAGRRREPCH